MPEILALCVCAMESEQTERIINDTVIQRKNKTRPEISMRSLLSRLAREVGCPLVRDRLRLGRLRTPSVSWLGGTAPRGLPAIARMAVARAEFLPPYSRAAATVFD